MLTGGDLMRVEMRLVDPGLIDFLQAYGPNNRDSFVELRFRAYVLLRARTLPNGI
ncbi:MAG: hypothetical protein ACRD6N_00410 [Pyrinomonadaceae bacterium]